MRGCLTALLIGLLVILGPCAAYSFTVGERCPTESQGDSVGCWQCQG